MCSQAANAPNSVCTVTASDSFIVGATVADRLPSLTTSSCESCLGTGPKDVRPKDMVSDFRVYLLRKDVSESYQTKDELYDYCKGTPKEISSLHAFKKMKWRYSDQSVYVTLCLWAFDTL